MSVGCAILSSSFIAALVALIVVSKQRIIAKKKTAYEFSLQLLSAELQTCEAVFLEAIESENISKIVDPQTHDEKRKKMDVARYLNHLELMCVSIRQNIVDEDVLKAAIGDILVKRHRAAVPLIDKIRKKANDPEFFEHLESISDKWRKNPKPSNSPWIFKILIEIFKT